LLIECFFKIKKMSINLQPQPGQPLSPPHDKPQDFAAPRTTHPTPRRLSLEQKARARAFPYLGGYYSANRPTVTWRSNIPFALHPSPLSVQRTAMAVGHASQDSARRGLG